MIPADWWIRWREDPRFREPLRYGFAKHCYQVVLGRLQQNRKHGRYPATWTELTEALAISGEGSVYRKRRGLLPTSAVECLGIATLLELEPSALVPSCEAWLHEAATRACRQGDASITEDEIRVCVEYLLQYFRKHRGDEVRLSAVDIEEQVMEDLARANGAPKKEVRASIQSVLACLAGARE